MGKRIRKRPAFRLRDMTTEDNVTPKEMLGLSLDFIYEKYPNMQPHGVKSRMLDAIQIVVGKHLEDSLGAVLDRINEQILTKNQDLERIKRRIEVEIMMASALTSKSKSNLSYDEIQMMREVNVLT